MRAGIADQDVNPIEWTISGGIGGRGLIPTRDDDSFGIGAFFIQIQETRFSGLLGVDDEGHGFEAFYNVAITPAAHLTLDVQVLDSPLPGSDTAVVIGLRMQMKF